MNDLEITIGDLKVVLELITLMCARGAVRPNELATVGAIYNKYLGIIEKVQKKEQVSEPPKAENT
jgi:hypothetical protein